MLRTGRAGRVCAVLILVIVGVVGVVPALSGATIPPPRTTGEKLNLATLCGSEEFEITFPADTPFYIAHGFRWLPGAEYAETRAGVMRPTTHFELFVDGVRAPSVPFIYYDGSTGLGTKANLTNYPNGFPSGGPHSFDGLWYDDGSLVGGTPGQSVLGFECAIMVTFSL